MFCGSCGKKIKDDARFCPYCGGIVGQGSADASATQPVSDTAQQAAVAQAEQQVAAAAQPTAPQPAQAVPVAQVPQSSQTEQGNVSTQVKQARRSSRKKMPMALFIVVIAMLAAGTAFAAAYVYSNFIAPAPEVTPIEEVQEIEPEPTEEQEPQTTTFSTPNFNGSILSGDGLDVLSNNITVASFTCDVPSGWSVKNEEQGEHYYSVDVVRDSDGLTVPLRIQLGQYSGLIYEPSSSTKIADSAMGSDYQVSFVAGKFLGVNRVEDNNKWGASFPYNSSYQFSDLYYTVWFGIQSTDGNSVDWSTFDPTSAENQDLIELLSSFRLS